MRPIAEALRAARIGAGLSQRGAAEQLGMPASFVSKIELGERRVDVVELAAICRAYGVDFVRFVRSLEL